MKWLKFQKLIYEYLVKKKTYTKPLNNALKCKSEIERYSFKKSKDDDDDIVYTTFTDNRLCDLFSLISFALVGIETRYSINLERQRYSQFFKDKYDNYWKEQGEARLKKGKRVLEQYDAYMSNTTEYNKLKQKSKANFCSRYNVTDYTLSWALSHRKEIDEMDSANEITEVNDCDDGLLDDFVGATLPDEVLINDEVESDDYDLEFDEEIEPAVDDLE